MLLSCWNWAKQREKGEDDLSRSVFILAVDCSDMTGWAPSAACWERAYKVLLNLRIYVNLKMVIFKGPF